MLFNFRLRQCLLGSNRLSNMFWALSTSLGGLGFFFMGLLSYFHVTLIRFLNSTYINFLPQGIVLLFYGSIGVILGIYLWLMVFWDVGSGYNEIILTYDEPYKQIILYRRGFPGRYRQLKILFKIRDLKTIKIKIEEGFTPKRQLLLCLKNNRNVPLTNNSKLLTLTQIERQAVLLSKYLNLPIETT